MRILVTRADDRAEATAERLRAAGHSVLIAPMTRIVATGAPLPRGPFAGIIATSPRAVRPLDGRALLEINELPLYAVGQQTAGAAQTHGFANIVVAGGTAQSLASLIAARHRGDKPLLYLAGSDRKPHMEAALAELGIAAAVVVMYRAEEVEALTRDQIKSLSHPAIAAALHYSRRSAEIFCRLMISSGLERLLRSARHCCISADAAMPLQTIGGLDVRIAVVPEEARLLEQL
jgi:uroporphyrinogen-III synthase